MAAPNVTVAAGGDKNAPSNESFSVEKKHMDGSNGESEVKKVDKVLEPTVPPPDESLVSTPKASSRGNASKAPSEESAMNYSPSPSSDHGAKSNDASPQILSQPVVSHVPASVQQPILHSSEQSSLASPAPQNLTQGGEGQQQQPAAQILEGKAAGGAPTFQVIHGTQGQVVTKQKGRFRLLQDSSEPPPVAGATDTFTAGAGAAVAPVGTAATGLEGVVATAVHPSRERSLSNTSTLSAKSSQTQVVTAAPSQTQVAAPAPATGQAQGNVPSNALTADSSRTTVANVPPVGKKKGRFVVIPGDVTDPSLLRQPFTGQQGALRQQTLQPPSTGEHAVSNPPQSSGVVAIAQPPMPPQEVAQQVPALDSQHIQQVPTAAPSQAQATNIVGSVQRHPQQMNPPQYYVSAPQAQTSGTPQLVQVSFAPQPQQITSSSPPLPPPSQPVQIPIHQQQSFQPPAQILLSETVHRPTYVVQTEDGRFHQVVAAPQAQHMVPIPEQQTAVPPETVPLQPQVHFQPTTQAPPTQAPPTGDVASGKPPQAAPKPASTAVKRPSVQRSNSITKGAPTNVGFGKVLHFLKQMELEVTEADRTIKNQARDMKFLRDKNKELEARSRDMERKWLEEKTAREALEAKVKSLKKKVRELKEGKESNGTDKSKEVDGKHAETKATAKPLSQSNSLDDVVASSEKEVSDTSAGAEFQKSPNASTGTEEQVTTAVEGVAVVHRSVSSESKESVGTADTKLASHQRPSEHTTTSVSQKATLSATDGPCENLRRSSSGDVFQEPKSSQSTKVVNEIPRPSQAPADTTAGSLSEKVTPPRRRCSKDAVGDKVATGKSPLPRASFKSQTVPTLDAPSGHAGVKTVASSSESLGSTSEFDPLRSGHVNVHADSSMSQTSDSVARGHQPTLSAGSSVASFATAPLPAQTIEFDPLSANHPGSTSSYGANSMHQAASEVQPTPQHGYSQSMPNFVVNQNMMSFPVHQVDMSMMNNPLSQQMQQGWNQNQPPGVGQSQYLPSQYSGVNAMGINQQQYPAAQVAVQQHPNYPSTNGTAADPFDELASRRGPGK